MKRLLNFSPVKMTPQVMQELDDKGLIIRLYPSREDHRVLDCPKEQSKGLHIYDSCAEVGTHSVVACTIDNTKFSSFATHPDCEEFLLLGGVNERSMYLLVSYLKRPELEKKIENDTLSESDFICLDCVFNDPMVSFFTMKAGVPHGECTYGEGRSTTFYVTEGSKTPLDKLDLYAHYDINVVK